MQSTSSDSELASNSELASTKRVVVTGATGFLGGQMVKALLSAGYAVTALVRNSSGTAASLPKETKRVAWDGQNTDALHQTLEGSYGIVHLAGESLAHWPWSAKRKKALRTSRIDLTHHLVNGIMACSRRPSVLVMASGAGYYGKRGAEPVFEDAPPGNDFLGQLAKAWEAEGFKAETLGLRVVPLRMGMILGQGGGALPALMRPFRFGLGAVLGSGAQGQAWIHREDAIGLALFALGNVEVTNALNACAPETVSQAKFSKTLAQVMHRPLFLKAPHFAIRTLLGEMADIVLHGQFAPPQKALAAGYVFRYPQLIAALTEATGQH